MTFQAAPGVAEVDIRGLLHGNLVENTLFLRQGDAWTPEQLASAASLMRGWWFASIMPNLSEDYIFREVFIKDLSIEAGDEASDATGYGIQGSTAFPALPGNVTFAVSFRTGKAGRSFRGRNYLPGIPSNEVSGDQISPSTAAGYAGMYEALLTALVGSDFTWVVLSRVADGVLRAAGLSTDVISVISTDVILDSMRRRLSGRGS
jgi:hypothetical protein